MSISLPKENLASCEHYSDAQPTVIASIAKLLKDGFENPEKVSGSCQFEFFDHQNTVWLLSVYFDKSRLELSTEKLEHIDSKIRMPIPIAEKIVSNIECVDYRDPEIIGQMEMLGNLNIVNHLAKSLVKPLKTTQATFLDATTIYRDAYAMTSIPYFDSPTEMEILEKIEKKQPFIIKNASMNIPFKKYSLEKLKNAYGNVLLRVRSVKEKETVAEFVEKMTRSKSQNVSKIIEGHTKVYTEGCLLPPQMIDDFLPHYFSKHDFSAPQIWLGSVPTDVPASSLHRDPLDGFLYQIMGRKKIVLFSPDQAQYLYPMKSYNNYQPCWVKYESPNLNDFPLFKNAKPIEVVLHPGEILVQPAGWFHSVYCLDSPTFSISYFLNSPTGVHLEDDEG